eukprot:gene17731-21123_t
MFTFNLIIDKGDFSTDGQWAFLMFTVHTAEGCEPQWEILKQRLASMCPDPLSPSTLQPRPSKKIFLFTVESIDRVGLLQGWPLVYSPELEFPLDDCVAETTLQLPRCTARAYAPLQVLNPNPGCIRGLNLVRWGFAVESRWPPEGAEAAIPQSVQRDRSVVMIDNCTSKAHTLVQVRAHDRKGLLYDCYRAVKDNNVQVTYGKIAVRDGVCELDLFVQDSEGNQLEDAQREAEMCRRLKLAIDLPILLSLTTSKDKLTTDLSVVTQLDAGGRGRPRVLHDVSAALSMVNKQIFK